MSLLLRLVAAAVAVAAVVLFVVNAAAIWDAVVLPTYWPASGKPYAFFSGPGSDISELVLVGGAYGLARKLNCHQHGCWRIGRFRHGHLVLCGRHHPLVPSDGRITADQVAAIPTGKDTNADHR